MTTMQPVKAAWSAGRLSVAAVALIMAPAVACAPRPLEPARLPANHSPGAATSSSSVLPIPAEPGPAVAIKAGRITVDGADAGSTEEVQRAGRLDKIDGLHQALKLRRNEWKESHPNEPFPGVAKLEVDAKTSGLVFVSAFQTLAFTGYPSISVVVNGRGLATRAMVPSPPCGAPERPCASGPPKYVLHVQADHRGWLLRVPREDGPVDLRSEARTASPDGLLEGVARLAAAQPIGAVIFHVAADATFAAVAPYLDAIVAFNGRQGLPGSVVVAARDIEQVRTAPARPIGPDLTAISGRLPPEVIQGVVRAAYEGFRDCYKAALKDDPTIAGSAQTRFVIERDGRVSEAKTNVTETLPPSVGSCMEARFRELHFPAPAGGIVTVVYPIRFSPGE